MQLNIIIFIDIYTDKLYGGDGWNQRINSLIDAEKKSQKPSPEPGMAWSISIYFTNLSAFPVA
jgi:hypothetical protein